MSEQMNENPLEMRKQGDLNTLRQLFNEPSRLSWNDSELKQLDDLYQIAATEDPEDPVGWVHDFNRSHPTKLEVGVETRRLGKILYLAGLHLDKQAAKDRKWKREF